MKKHRLQSNFAFRMMSLEFRLRDMIRPPVEILQAAGARFGMTVLDLGCGPGSFSLAAARLVGPKGRVWAVDIHPLAVESVRQSAEKEGIDIIRTVHGDTIADIPGGTVDIALLYDVLHEIPEPGPLISELYRVLKPDGVLSVSDHHLKEAPLLSTVTRGGLFIFTGQSRWSFQFGKTETGEVTL